MKYLKAYFISLATILAILGIGYFGYTLVYGTSLLADYLLYLALVAAISGPISECIG